MDNLYNDLEIKIMEERLKIARIQNESLNQQLNNLNAANMRLEREIEERENAIFWNDIRRELNMSQPNLIATCNDLPTINMPLGSQLDIVASAYVYLSHVDLENVGLIRSNYFDILTK
ncbi:coiled-coiled domain protein [Faustovirus]|nr:coiled-coiled domain protein [Faustovirus]